MQLSTQSGGRLSLRLSEPYPLTERFAERHADALLMFLQRCPLIAVSWSFRSSQMGLKQLDLQFRQQAKAGDQQPSRLAAQA
jgi:hypothetical protein